MAFNCSVFLLAVILSITLPVSPASLHFDRDKANDLAKGLSVLLDAIIVPVRLNALVCWDIEAVRLFSRAIQDAEVGHPLPLIGIYPDLAEYFPGDSSDQHHELIVVDVECRENIWQLIEHTKMRMRNRFKWVFISSADKDMAGMEEIILNILSDCPILPRSEIFFISSAGKQLRFQQVYRVASSEPLILENFGTFSNNTFVDERGIDGPVKRRQNLRGITLRASMVITDNDTLNHLDDYIDKHIDTISKSNYVLTNYLVAYVNATVQYSIVSSWGYRDRATNGWDGMIGDLVADRADIGATALFMTDDRAGTIQYIAMPSATGSQFIFRAPKLSYTDNVFLLPFDDLVWLCLVALVFVTAVFLTVATFAEWRVPLATPLDTADAGLLPPAIGDVFLLVFGATCQQGSAVAPRSTTARIIMVLVFTILMFLYTSYSANIVALLQSPSRKIRTLKDLYASRLRMGVDDTVYNHYYFTHQTEPVRKAIFEQKITNRDGSTNFVNFREGIRRVREGLYAFHVERSVGYQLISETFYEDEKCGLQGIEFFQMTDPWYAVQKNSSYEELLQSGMMRIHEHGLQDRENSRLYTSEPKCTGAGGHFVTASLVDTGPAMLVLLWGFGFATALLVAEIAVKRLGGAKRKRQGRRREQQQQQQQPKQIPFLH